MSGGRPATASRNARSQKPCLNASALRLAKIDASRCDVRYDSQAAPLSAAPTAMKPAARPKIVLFDNRCLPTCTVPCANASRLAFKANFTTASRRVRRPHAPGNLSAALAFNHRYVVLLCKSSQNWALLPKYRPRRPAVSAVMERRPFKMSVIRPDGTPMSSASRLALNEREVNSRFSRRPGCAAGGMVLILYGSRQFRRRRRHRC